MRHTAFVVLPGFVAVVTLKLLSPDLSGCVVGSQAGITLTFVLLARLVALVLLSYSVMLVVRLGGRARSTPHARQIGVLLLSLGVMLLIAAVLSSHGFVLFDAPPVNTLCKNAPGYLG
jgi:hypothetical protein